MNLTDDPVEATFEICDLNNDGLTKEEVIQDNCKETLETFFGFTEEGFDDMFDEIDIDGDGKITIGEGMMACERVELFDRCGKDCGNCPDQCQHLVDDGVTCGTNPGWCNTCSGNCKIWVWDGGCVGFTQGCGCWSRKCS